MLLLGMAAMSLSAYDKAQAEADAKLIRIYEEENRIFKDLQWHEETRDYQWVLFYGLQALDVYSTHRGLKYDCIREGNPLLGDRPTVPHMITHKTIFLAPIWMLQNEGIYTKQEINLYNSMSGVVVYNNFRLLERAKEKCNKR